MPSNQIAFSKINESKADFDHIYHQPDPREYFRVLCGLDYVIPELARVPFQAIFDALRATRGPRLKIADLGCSYGVNASLLRYPLDLARLTRRYSSPDMQRVDATTLAELDKNYFRSWPSQHEDMFVGIDTSLLAVQYALQTGLIEAAVTTNLEQREPTASEIGVLRGLNIVISTGCIGYTTEKSLRRILCAQGPQPLPWVASLVLRMFPYDSIAAELARFGLVTEKLEGVTFVQRRFHSAEEFDQSMALLEGRGIDPTGKEAEGLLHAELYLSRPAAETGKKLQEIVSITSGAHRRYGRRFVKDSLGAAKLIN